MFMVLSKLQKKQNKGIFNEKQRLKCFQLRLHLDLWTLNKRILHIISDSKMMHCIKEMINLFLTRKTVVDAVQSAYFAWFYSMDTAEFGVCFYFSLLNLSDAESWSTMTFLFILWLRHNTLSIAPFMCWTLNFDIRSIYCGKSGFAFCANPFHQKPENSCHIQSSISFFDTTFVLGLTIGSNATYIPMCFR